MYLTISTMKFVYNDIMNQIKNTNIQLSVKLLSQFSRTRNKYIWHLIGSLLWEYKLLYISHMRYFQLKKKKVSQNVMHNF